MRVCLAPHAQYFNSFYVFYITALTHHELVKSLQIYRYLRNCSIIQLSITFKSFVIFFYKFYIYVLRSEYEHTLMNINVLYPIYLFHISTNHLLFRRVYKTIFIKISVLDIVCKPHHSEKNERNSNKTCKHKKY